jgi:hypothetical protein
MPLKKTEKRNTRKRTIAYQSADYIVSSNPTTNATILNTALAELYAIGGGTLDGCHESIIVDDTIIFRSDELKRVNIENLTLILDDGSNVNLVESWDYANQVGSNDTSVGCSHFYWSNVTLNGNRQANTSGSCFVRYGYAGVFYNVTIANAAENNVDSEWSVGAEATFPGQLHNGMEDVWIAPRIYNAGNINVNWKGPHDSIWVSPLIFNDGSIGTVTNTNLFIRASSVYASGPLFVVGGHIWGKTQESSVITETTDPNNSAKLVGTCDVEGALTTGKYAIDLRTGGNYLFAHVYFSANGIKVNGNHNTLDIKVSNIEQKCIDLNSVSSSVLRFHVEAGNATTTLAYNDPNATANILDLQAYQGTGTDYFAGTIGNINNGNANRIVCIGLASTVHIHTFGETLRIRDNKVTIVGNQGEQLKAYSTAVGGDIWNLNATSDPAFQFPNQTKLEGFSGNYTDMTWRISTWNGKAEFRQLNLSNLPTSATGLSAGDVYVDAGNHLRIV